MKQQTNKWQILLAIGLLFVTSGTTLNRYEIIGDGFNGFLIGIGLGLEILAVIRARNNQQCGLRLK